MVSCWADISVCLDDSLTWCLFGLATCFHLNQYTAQKKDQVEWGGCGHQERAPICSDMKNTGQHWSPGRDACTQVPLVTLWMFSKFFLVSVLWYTLILKGSQRVGVVFSWSQAHQLANLMANLCQSEMRVKWPGKSKYSPSFGWHLGDCSHSAHWYALYYVLLTCSQWHSPALAPLR